MNGNAAYYRHDLHRRGFQRHPGDSICRPLLRRSCFLLLSPHTILIDFIKRISIYNNLMHTLTCCFSSILTIFHLGGTGACRRADSGSKICLGNI